MSGNSTGGNESDGAHSSPGGGPLVVVPGASPSGGTGSVLLSLPATLTANADDEELRRLNLVQIEYARDVAQLQSRAYDAILSLLTRRDSE